jgi:uncharacterized UPF0160 family protein
MTEKEKEIERYIEKLSVKIRENYLKTQAITDGNLRWNELNPIRNEIFTALNCKLYHAAITLTTFFIERMMKLALIYNEAGYATAFDENNIAYAAAVDKYDNGDFTFAKSLKKCCSLGLMTKEQKVKLENERERTRNGFAHGSASKILENKESRFIIQAKDSDIGIEYRIPAKYSHPFLQAVAFQDVVRSRAFAYFQLAHDTLRMLEETQRQKTLQQIKSESDELSID